MKRITQYRILQALSHTALSARVLMVAVLAGVLTLACDVHGITAPGILASMTVTPDATLTVGATQQMTAVGYDADGHVVPVSPTWSVAKGGGTIASTGLFTAGATLGLFAHTVVASVGSISANASITVIPGALATIVVMPTPVTLAVTSTQQFIAVGYDALGNIVQVTPTWSVVNSTAGSINGSTGLFTAGTVAGTYLKTVQATSGAISGFATVNVTVGPLASITVSPNPSNLSISGTQTFTAVGKDASGNVLVIVPVWSVVNATAGSINSGTGLFTAGTVSGPYLKTVQATSGGISGFATVNVAAGALFSITVSPNPSNLATGGTQTFTAVGKDVNGNIVGIVPAWSVVNATAGSINGGTGLFTAGTVAGAYPNTVQATSGAISGFATVNVTVGSLFSITVSPNPSNLSTGGTQTFTAVGKDAGNNVVVFVPFWSVVNPLAGGINSGTGSFTAGAAPGTYNNTVQAASGAVSGFATVIIAAPSPLLSAANYGILSGAAINCAVSGSVTGASSTANLGSGNQTINGFPLPCTFDGSIPLPGVVTAALIDLGIAYNAMQPAPGTCAGILPYPAGNNLSGLDLGVVAPPLPPGNYCFSSTAGLTGNLTLTGLATDKWTFTMESGLTTAVGSTVTLAGGAIPDNVYWVVGSSATLGSTSDFSGNILAQSAITLNNGATLHGRALARTAAVQMIAGAASIIKP